jgi:hypothetical protein
MACALPVGTAHLRHPRALELTARVNGSDGQLDRWERISSHALHSSSAIDMFSIIFTMLEQFFPYITAIAPHGADAVPRFVELLNQVRATPQALPDSELARLLMRHLFRSWSTTPAPCPQGQLQRPLQLRSPLHASSAGSPGDLLPSDKGCVGSLLWAIVSRLTWQDSAEARRRAPPRWEASSCFVDARRVTICPASPLRRAKRTYRSSRLTCSGQCPCED